MSVETLRSSVPVSRSTFRRMRGSAVGLTIVVAVIISGLIVALATVAGTHSASARSLSKQDQAFYAAEAGASRVAWFCRNHQMATISAADGSGSLTGSVNGYSYSVTWTLSSGSTISLSSTGYSGTSSYVLTELVTPPSPGVPVISSSGDFDNKNLNITGDVSVAGNYTNTGSGSLNGNLTYSGSESNYGSVTGTTTKGAFTPIDFSALNTTLTAGATAKAPGATYDFTAISGTNKVIYVNGNVTDPSIIGGGTLYINGSLTFTSTVTLGTTSAPVYLVATGDVTSQKKTTIVGGLYTAGIWNRAQIDITGVVYVSGVDPSNSGSSTLTLGTAPWFDPRSGGGTGTATMMVTNFTGPQP